MTPPCALLERRGTTTRPTPGAARAAGVGALRHHLAEAREHAERVLALPPSALSKTGLLPLPHVRIGVTDQGYGISPEDQARLFSQFFRSDDPLVREQAGWGLGLHITRRLVELLGGEISLQSELGKGSTFAFIVPVDV